MKLKQVPEDFIVEEQGNWHTVPGPFTLFTLTKKNLGTMEAVKKLARLWHRDVKDFGYAGLKDKRAVTTQMCSVRNHAVAEQKLHDITITPFGQTDRPVHLGSHKGNKFTITVRDIDRLPAEKKTFLNLFGEQRFGSTNADIGKALVQQDYARVLELLRELHLPEVDALEQSIADSPTDKLRAVQKIPLRLLRLFVHAYQSKLWNELVEHTTPLPAKLPIIGFGTEEDDLVRAQLKREKLTTRSFVLKSFPQLSEEGMMRKTTVDVDLQIGDLQEDELNPGRKKCVISFTLPPGGYATEIIRQLFHNS